MWYFIFMKFGKPTELIELTYPELTEAESLMSDIVLGNLSLDTINAKGRFAKKRALLRARHLSSHFGSTARSGLSIYEVEYQDDPRAPKEPRVLRMRTADLDFLSTVVDASLEERSKLPHLQEPARNEYVAHWQENVSVIKGLKGVLSTRQ
jgi:hypothetical protein